MGRRYILSIIIVTLLLVLFSFLFSSKEMDMFVKVDDYVGFNADTSALYFGTVAPGNSAFRFLELNSVDKVRVIIVPFGKIKKLVSFSENNFVLEGNKSVKINVNIPKNAEFGEYSGKLKLYFLKTL